MNDQILYKDSVIVVKILTDEDNEALKSIVLRYLKTGSYKGKDGNEVFVTNTMGGVRQIGLFFLILLVRQSVKSYLSNTMLDLRGLTKGRLRF